MQYDLRIVLLFLIALVVFAAGLVAHKKSRVARTEIFVGLLWLLLFVHVFDYHILPGLVLNVAILAFAIVFGYLLIRSVTKEAEQRKNLELLSLKLTAANEELQKLDKMKSDFISIVSHQFRSPLSMMKGYLSMAIEGNFGKLTVGLYEKLQRVYESNERLVRLVNDLLDLARIEKGTIEYKFSEINLRKLIESVLDEVKANIEGRKFRVVKNIESGFSNVNGDESKLRQVFANLIDNAIHYTPAGSGTITIRTAKSADGKGVIITVKDTGIGMDREDLHAIFTQFGRGSGASHYYTEGLGLGLFVARRIITDHGGKIWAESEGTNKGSIFYVELPINKSE